MRDEKTLLLDEMKAKIDSSSAMIIAKYNRLPPNLSWEFRDKLAQSGSLLEVVKKRVFLKAAQMSGIEIDESLLKGHIGVVFVQQSDAIPSAKAVYQFTESNKDLLEVVCGQIEGEMCSSSDVELLSKLPGLEEMRAQFIALLVSPMTQTLAIFEAVMSQPLSILEQKSKES